MIMGDPIRFWLLAVSFLLRKTAKINAAKAVFHARAASIHSGLGPVFTPAIGWYSHHRHGGFHVGKADFLVL